MYANLDFLKRQIALLSWYINNFDESPAKKLFITAVCSLGTDASPNDEAPDEYGCANTVDCIHKKALGSYVGPTLTLSTNQMYKSLKSSNKWQIEAIPAPGDIVISPTGYGTNPQMPNGHVGYISTDNKIMSNNSYTGLFEENYTLDTWRERYVVKGGYPMLFFRRLT